MFHLGNRQHRREAGLGASGHLRLVAGNECLLFNCHLITEGWIAPLSITWHRVELLCTSLPPTQLFSLKLPQFVKVSGRAADPSLDPRAGEKVLSPGPALTSLQRL